MTTTERVTERISSFNLILALIGGLIICTWILVIFRLSLAVLPIVAIPATVLTMAVSLLIHFVALSVGNHLMSWAASAFVLLLATGGVLSLNAASRTDMAVIAGISVLAYNESLRLSFAQRRRAIVDKTIYISSAVSVAVVGMVAAIGVQVAKLGLNLQPTTSDGETLARQNWWVFVSVVTLIAAVFAVLLVPAFRRQRQYGKRFRPGDRIDLSTLDPNNPLNQRQ